MGKLKIHFVVSDFIGKTSKNRIHPLQIFKIYFSQWLDRTKKICLCRKFNLFAS